MPSADNEPGMASPTTKAPLLWNKKPPGTESEGACIFEVVLYCRMKPQEVVKQWLSSPMAESVGEDLPLLKCVFLVNSIGTTLSKLHASVKPTEVFSEMALNQTSFALCRFDWHGCVTL